VDEYREVNGVPDGVPVPVDAVTGSSSGLDPHISPANANLQAPRVADSRGLPVEEVLALVDEHTDRRPLAIMGDDAVNVLELNVALDALGSP
jgi:K+-transporting ATPase ATPase C chain